MYRVIQWATGECGQKAIQAIAAHPDLELVGARVYDPAKVGRDVGELCGIAPLGVEAENDEEALLALEADCVLWMGAATMFGPGGTPESGIDELCRILRSGKNLISIVHEYFIHPASLPERAREQVEEACRAGGASFHATGIDPGFNTEVLGLQLTSLCRRLDEFRAFEILDYGLHNNRQILFDVMGFGRRPEEAAPTLLGPSMVAAYCASLRFLADALGLHVDELRWGSEHHLAARTYEIPAGTIHAGTVSALRYFFEAVVEGRPRLAVEHVTRLGADQAPDWAQGDGYLVRIRGEPDLRMQLSLGRGTRDPRYYPDSQHVAVPMRAVHSIPAVCEAPPGIRTFMDLGLVPGGFCRLG